MWRVEITPARFDKLARLGYLRGDALDPKEGARAIEHLLDAIELP
jgi:hypothetical protein